MALYRYPSSSQATSKPVGITEFEILKASHKFLREEEERPATWDEKLAEKYYTSLYREFAVCDLKHYKSGNFALRWRTEEEVLDGSGETTCGNTRCEHHFPSRLQSEEAKPALTTLELPFTYVEHGESKSALVKVILCGRCVEKLMWKHNKEKEKRRRAEEEAAALHDSHHPEEEEESLKSAKNKNENDRAERHRQKKRSRETIEERERSHKRRTSRSKSPQQRHKDGKSAKRRSFHSRSHET
ncbi:folate-sensitive fragile site protein Fra10Ac1-domain-containing protein [Gymnopilus junonius]|uniref:Folate-sensitive fragile site protein Fra10Ac1-domain-containing protein n=1 Tax=Gymnopilus junonius TaxID=109634 RepID=A0A9P5NV07_GYMJU|nr:folate-sensitive fragile site protein Fra10Ac1-domain-containing protein [Gymnopilus junonius]